MNHSSLKSSAMVLALWLGTACGNAPAGSASEAGSPGGGVSSPGSGGGTSGGTTTGTGGGTTTGTGGGTTTGTGGTTTGTGGGTTGTGGGTTGTGGTTGGTGGGTGSSCLASGLLQSLGKDHLLVGAMMTDNTAKTTPFDLRYVYLTGGLFDGDTACTSCASGCTAGGTSCANGACSWWGCWQWDQLPPGQYAVDLLSSTKSQSQIPTFTYYQILPAGRAGEGAGEVRAANDANMMRRYFADWRFLLQKIGSSTAFLHIEPDFWGYAQQMNSNPHLIPAAVASANPTDCADLENSIAGMGRCMIAMVRKYAPNAKVGLHASGWATKTDVLFNRDPSLDVAGEARKVANFLVACGADKGDFVVVETSDRDAGYYSSIGQNRWWDATNATLPNFHQEFTWAKALAETVGLPLLWWQVPVGNMSLSNSSLHWRDNRVDYFFDHLDEVTAAHGVGVAFGAGATGQTTPESDNGHLSSRARSYAAQGGHKACQ